MDGTNFGTAGLASTEWDDWIPTSAAVRGRLLRRLQRFSLCQFDHILRPLVENHDEILTDGALRCFDDCISTFLFDFVLAQEGKSVVASRCTVDVVGTSIGLLLFFAKGDLC